MYEPHYHVTPCEQEEHDSLMTRGGLARHSVRAQLDYEENKPEDAEEHWDSKPVPQRDSHSKKSVQLDHLRVGNQGRGEDKKHSR